MNHDRDWAMRDLNRLIEAVQRNCDIADARYGREATLCIYLLQMRELYCWEHELPLAAQPPHDALADWLSAREAKWSTLEGRDFEALALGERRFAPLDAARLNRELLPPRLVYGAGAGRVPAQHHLRAARSAAPLAVGDGGVVAFAPQRRRARPCPGLVGPGRRRRGGIRAHGRSGDRNADPARVGRGARRGPARRALGRNARGVERTPRGTARARGAR